MTAIEYALCTVAFIVMCVGLIEILPGVADAFGARSGLAHIQVVSAWAAEASE